MGKPGDSKATNKGGRPSAYTDALGKDICERIANGESLRSICAEDGMPSQSMVYRWVLSDEAFRENYRVARECQLEKWADELVLMSDAALGMPAEGVSAVKLSVNTRQWLLSKLLPKKYGDKVTQEVTGPNGGPVENTLRVEFVDVGAGEGG